MIQTMTIEQLWHSLRVAGPSVLHRRVDGTHPLELYAEIVPPDRPGLVLFCPEKPPTAPSLRTLLIEQGRRPDGRWWLRISLMVPALLPVFTGLCQDIVTFTRTGTSDHTAAAAILARLDRWRKLLMEEHEGLTSSVLRGLIAELVVLEGDILPILSAMEAISSWRGPLGMAQDFLLPSGQRIEVKSVRPDATSVKINGLDQLDSSSDPLTLTLVRLADCGVDAEGAVTAQRVINRLRERLVGEPLALNEFESRLAAGGWHSHPEHEKTVVRVVASERYPMGPGFPRLIRTAVPIGVEDADYTISIPLLRSLPGAESKGLT